VPLPATRDDLVDLLSQLVAIDSTNPDLVPGGAGEGEIAAFVAGWLSEAGLEVETHEAEPGRPNVVGRALGRGGGRSLLLNAHMDTVAAGGMERPFVPEIREGRLYGRGSYDMKASLTAIMLVGRAATELGLGGDVVVTAVADEEYASVGTQAIVARYRDRVDAAIVAEPTDLELCVAHKGFVWLEVETRGVAAHGSLPDEGVDAIAKMGRVLVGLDELDRRLRAGAGHPLLGTGSIHASLIAGGTELSTYPDSCRLQVERRTVPGEPATLVQEQVQAILDETAASDPTFQAELWMGLVREPFGVPEDEPIVQILRERATAALGEPPPLTGAGGWMDSALLAAAGVPTVVFGPAGAGAHADVEWVDLSSLERCYEILLETVRAFCT
jgi:acetylornithine deacetylase